MKIYAPELFRCVVYQDGGLPLYSTPLEQSVGALECECRCPMDSSTLSLDFRLAIDSYFHHVSFKAQCLQNSVEIHSIEVAHQTQISPFN